MRRISLALYNVLFLPVLLILLPGYLLRIRKRGGYGNKALQRLGILDAETTQRIGQGRIWIHAVSVGEAGIALKFAGEFHRRNPSARFLISTTTSTGVDILEKSASEWLEPMANPIDFPIITSRLIRKLRPAALLMVEADLWPNRIAACKSLGIPVALLNARLSERSQNRFRLSRTYTAPLFNQLDLITLTEPEDEARWISLGIHPELLHLTGNIKHDSPDSLPSSQIGELTLLAASTHAGEEEEIAKAYRILRNEKPGLRLVIAPRHVERRHDIRDSLGRLGLSCRLRSEGGCPSSDPLLLDTTGELSSWYSGATVVFVGKSLPCSKNKGGQNMIEPLQGGAPVLIGPHTGNFEPLATQLCEAGAAIRVKTCDEIAATARLLLADEAKRSSMVASANSVLKPHQGSSTRNCELVETLLSASS